MMSKAGLGIGVVFALMGIGVGMLVLYLASRQASLEGASNRLLERSGRMLTIRTKLRSRRAFDLRAEVSVLAYGPGWSGYVEPCSSTQDFTLVPSQEHIVSAGCEQSWLEIDDAHLEVRVRVQERRNDERIHLASRTLRVPGLCPAPR